MKYWYLMLIIGVLGFAGVKANIGVLPGYMPAIVVAIIVGGLLWIVCRSMAVKPGKDKEGK